MENQSQSSLRDHLANERTLLAWIRTSIGIMAFGFVVVKFSLFIKQLSILLQKPIAVSGHGYASIIGILLVAFGVVIALFSLLRYKMTDSKLTNPKYRPSNLLPVILTICVILIGIFLVWYLIQSV